MLWLGHKLGRQDTQESSLWAHLLLSALLVSTVFSDFIVFESVVDFAHYSSG